MRYATLLLASTFIIYMFNFMSTESGAENQSLESSYTEEIITYSITEEPTTEFIETEHFTTEIITTEPIPETTVPAETEAETETETETEPVIVSPYILTDKERTLLGQVMMSECAYEPFEGQMAVAQVVLDRLLNDSFPDTVREVLTQKNQFAPPSKAKINDSVMLAIIAVFDNGERVTENELLYFYSPRYTYSRFHEGMKFVVQIGNHKFFR